ncbi:pantetheine-phosphate adenylyltransferase [Desulfobotulus sp. H1]|uniref:Phosphopantetheine adenylyltransferase n=1 Tax=Desulfobotulus pelophilus TaxID=2823377 RepID=A0ABT3NBF2_9BACT|nr:pantetheine-phosphate adenylyltransferase [Desulfobotulus pelophilus]MCW7754788.1 pantetheine-phosphate adenylyltransferase [Desulfobotulus pelophilus]
METFRNIAIYPGSFDPLTNGHIDIIERALGIFDKVIVAILHNPNKTGFFTVEERKDLIRESLAEHADRIEVDSFDGLLVDYAEKKGAKAIVRGMRAMGDFESEFQMAMMNRRLNRDVQTVFLITGLRWIFTSSSVIKEAASFGADISGMVSPAVLHKLQEKMKQKGIRGQ